MSQEFITIGQTIMLFIIWTASLLSESPRYVDLFSHCDAACFIAESVLKIDSMYSR